jgi:hypothetical protein
MMASISGGSFPSLPLFRFCTSSGLSRGSLDLSAAIEGLENQIAAIDAGLVRIVKAMQEQ